MIRKKVVFLPYDMDTAIGINNSGLLVFSYNLEDTDLQQGGEFIFNGQDSVLWTNLRDAFGDQIKTMYQNLRSQGKLSYALVERMFEEHQAKWSEAIFNEDAFFKYIEPLTNPDEGKQPDASYLPMAQGSKAEQRKWWLYNRFRYMDSKWNAGDALTDYIMMRAYSVAPQVLTPYADIYLTTSWDGELTQVRAHRGQTYTLPCPKDSANDAVVAIYSASQLASVGDLSGLKIKNGNFSMATRLQELKIGDSASTYSNTNLIDLQLGNNTLLRTIDVRNCPNLAITVDLSGCKNIENVYFDGTGIAGVVLPNGGVLTTLHLPDTVTNLTVQNQPNITDFVLNDASNLSTLRLENCGELMDDAKELVAEMEGGSRIRLIGINWEFPTSQQLSDLYDLLDTMRGLDESGGNMPKVQISGVINVEYFSGDMAAMQERYPNVRITADHTIAILTYKTYDGASTLYTETINDGGNGTKTNSQSRDSDAQYSYTPNGWATEVNGNTNPNALVNVVGDRIVYAAYTKTLRKYTVTFVKSSTDGGGTLQTISNVDYGTVITAASAYTGATPTTSQGSAEDYPFDGWNPASATVQGNTVFTAVFKDTTSPTRQLIMRTIKTVNSQATTIGNTAFSNCSSLTSVDLPVATTIGNQAFDNCTSLTSVDLPVATSIGSNVFLNCTSLTSVDLPVATSIGSNAFQNCTSLTSVDLPVATSIGGYAFQNCSKLTSIDLPVATSIESNAFRSCTSLTSVDLPVATSIGGYAFYGCSRLTSLILRNTSKVTTLSNKNAFTSVNTVIIYVPDELVDDYKAANNWSTYANRIKGLSELGE